MSHYDKLYRALTDYRKNTREDKECVSHRNAIVVANNDADIIKITSNICTVNEDWVIEIEQGIVYIEKAINEARQFIRSNGEVVPIEKVKHVSKDTVEHLAKHSNLVTREPEPGHDLVPDNLYMVERLSDYAVYENRFLYMLLCYLRDFIGMRYEKILELTNTYQGSMQMNKTVVESSRRLVYEVNLVEEKKNDEYLKEHNSAKSILDRILVLYEAVNFFLGLPLMLEVAKTPMLKPPITRTNVLRMNQNFRRALSLYEFVAAYEGKGYEIITEEKTFSPLSSFVADELAETVELSSFLTYEYGLEIKEYFKRRYEREEQKRKEEERKKHEERLKGIKRELELENITPEEYIIMLEKRIADLEAEREDLAEAYSKIDELNELNDKLQGDLNYANKRIEALEAEIVALKIKYEEDMAAEKKRHAEEVAQLKTAHAEEIQKLNAEHAEEIVRINTAHEEEITKINTAHKEEVNKINAEHAEEILKINTAHAEEITKINNEHAEEVASIKENHRLELERITEAHKQEVDTLNAEHEKAIAEQKATYDKLVDRLQKEHDKEVKKLNNAIETIKKESEETIKLRDYVIDRERRKFDETFNKQTGKLATAERKANELEEKCKELSDLNTLSNARLTALRSQYGLIKENEDFTTREMADELESQYKVFRQFRNRQWAVTKKRIKNEVFYVVQQNEEERDKKKLAKKQLKAEKKGASSQASKKEEKK